MQKNLDGSLNMLLKRIAEQYQLDLVAVFENDDLGMTMTNYYADSYSFYEKSVFPKTNLAVELLKPGEYTIITQDVFQERDIPRNRSLSEKRSSAGYGEAFFGGGGKI